MNAEERKMLLKSRNLQFENLERAIKDAVNVRSACQAELQSIEGQSELSLEGKNRRKSDVAQKYAGKFQANNTEIAEKLSGLEKTLSELANDFDLSSPEFAAALRLIELAGPELDYQTLEKINSSFVGNQSTLRALKATYKARDMNLDGGLSEMLYDIQPTFENLKVLAELAFRHQGSINNLSAELSRLAKSEGLEFPGTVDAAGFEQAARRGAGLT